MKIFFFDFLPSQKGVSIGEILEYENLSALEAPKHFVQQSPSL